MELKVTESPFQFCLYQVDTEARVYQVFGSKRLTYQIRKNGYAWGQRRHIKGSFETIEQVVQKIEEIGK
jgi:hypothetical protein